MGNRVLLAVTPGDPEGIGPEIVWKSLQSNSIPENVTLVCFGARAPFDQLGAQVLEVNPTDLNSIPDGRNHVLLVPAPTNSKKGRFLPGYQSGWAIETATKWVQKGVFQALVTGPISKDRLQKGGYPYPGHTEFLARLCRRKDVTMMLANDQLRVTLVTTHLALARVPRALNRSNLTRTITQTVEHLRQWWGIQNPRVAIAALNPHAGEGGLFGSEEKTLIGPVVQSLAKKLKNQATLIGPLPSDTLFSKHLLSPTSERFDAVVCMYHDQALIPVKMLDFPRTVNVTLGLPIIRTSVDHGVGFDIVGTGRADPSSFQSAVRMAAELVQNRGNQ